MPLVDAVTGRYRDTKIELRTRANSDIDNLQAWEHSRMEWDALGQQLNRFTKAQRLGEACPVYNCHGLTFASRRTSVPPGVMPILRDDGFEEIDERSAQVGDIVVYSNTRGEIVHSGFVVGVDQVEIVQGTKPTIIPQIWSKWGKGHEWVHPVGECPYLQEEGNFTKYYRLLKWQPA